MYLSEFKKQADLDIIRDGVFESLAKIDNLNPKGGNLVFLSEILYLKKIDFEKVSSIIVSKDLVKFFIEVPAQIGIAVSEKPRTSFYKIHNILYESGYYHNDFKSEISPRASISGSAKISSNNVHIGDGTIIGEGVIIGENVHIGKNCVIQPGVILGFDCMEVFEIDGQQKVVPHVGGVLIKDGAVIQSGTTIARSLFQHNWTTIGEEVIIGGNVYISHGVSVGAKTKIAGGTIISGNTSIGKNCWIGPGVIISNNLKIGDNVRIIIGSVVGRDVADNQEVSGHFAVDSKIFMKFVGRMMADK